MQQNPLFQRKHSGLELLVTVRKCSRLEVSSAPMLVPFRLRLGTLFTDDLGEQLVLMREADEKELMSVPFSSLLLVGPNKIKGRVRHKAGLLFWTSLGLFFSWRPEPMHTLCPLSPWQHHLALGGAGVIQSLLCPWKEWEEEIIMRLLFCVL